SWRAPNSKLVRVRSDGLKNSSAIDLPASCVPSLWRLNAAACRSSASSSARLKSWVVMKCFNDIDSNPEKKKPGARPGFVNAKNERRSTGRNENSRSARARGHAGGHAGTGHDVGGNEGTGLHARIMPRFFDTAQAAIIPRASR